MTQQDTNRVVTGISGKQYLFSCTVAVTTAPDGDFTLNITDFANASTAVDFTAGSKAIRFVSKAGAESADFVISGVSGDDTEGTFSIDDVSLIGVGCVASLDYRGLNNKQWKDPLTGVLGVNNGAIPFGIEDSTREVYLIKDMAADGNAVIVPAGYRLDHIIVQNTTTNAVNGGLDIGTNASGEEVVSQEAVGASALVECTLILNLFSMTSSQTLHFSAHTAWNSAILDVYFVMTRLI